MEKLVWLGYADGEKIWRYVYLFWQNPRTCQTHTHTDRRSPHDDISCACIASRGKNDMLTTDKHEASCGLSATTGLLLLVADTAWRMTLFLKVCWCCLPKIIKISLHVLVETTDCQSWRVFETQCILQDYSEWRQINIFVTRRRSIMTSRKPSLWRKTAAAVAWLSLSV